MLGRRPEAVGTLRSLAWAWVLGSLRAVPLLKGKWELCLPHELPVQSCVQCLPASAAMQSERVLEGLGAGAGVPLLQKVGMLPAQVHYPRPGFLSWGFEHLLNHSGGAFGTGVPCLLVFLGAVIYFPCLSMWKCCAVVGAKCRDPLQLRAVEVGCSDK